MITPTANTAMSSEIIDPLLFTPGNGWHAES